MIYYYDLHIHSCLSACADLLLSPNNIFNMAHLKGLDLISVTDHNSLKQYQTLEILEKSYDICLIPGVEVTTIEDIHVLIYLKSFQAAHQFDGLLETFCHQIPYDIDVYGEQNITDIEDQPIRHIDYLLSKPLTLSIFELEEILKPFEHIKILAHLDRMKHSALPFLDRITFDAIELTCHKDQEAFIKKHNLSRFKIFYNSDAHQLMDILEKTEKNQIELESLSIDAFFKVFKHG
ncbi:MAG: hypothetical protein ACNA7K_05740 [Acholeplasmataceae bacterium]